MLMLSVPMVIFYEVSILIGRIIERRRSVARLMAVPEPHPGYDFPLDPFQQRAIAALDEGRSVLVAAPTGSGKTVVAEHAVAKALAEGRKAFYTAPIKALSNQKFTDLARRHGSERVGLLTGDNAINGDAPGGGDDHRGAPQHDLRRPRRRCGASATSCSTRCTSSRTPTAARCGRR